jgi:vesicular inhibitory amino acid transporter
MGIDAIRHAGGVNSIENFARSWQRAAGFYEITPQIPPLVVSPEAAETAPVGARRYSDVEHGIAPKSPLSVLREEAAGEQAAESAADEAHGDSPSDHRSTDRASKAFESGDRDIYVAAPHLASQYGASFGTSYGSFSSQAGEHSMTHAGRLWRQQQERGASVPDKEREPLLVRRVEREDGKVVNVVVGQSTLPQTIFNSVNVLIGVGLLSLPLAVRYAGWLVGMTFLVLSAVVTAYAARILAKCLDVDEALITFADLAYISFGGKARIVTSLLFGVEIYAANVALVVLFADSLAALVPALGSAEWKIVCGIILLPLGFVPLHILSFTSVLGIFSCFGSKDFL